jgi:hypothetical protein
VEPLLSVDPLLPSAAALPRCVRVCTCVSAGLNPGAKLLLSVDPDLALRVLLPNVQFVHA